MHGGAWRGRRGAVTRTGGIAGRWERKNGAGRQFRKTPINLGLLFFYRFTVGKTGVMALLDFGANPRIP